MLGRTLRVAACRAQLLPPRVAWRASPPPFGPRVLRAFGSSDARFPANPDDVEHPRPPGPAEAHQGNWVSDAPKILSPESTAAINRDIETLNATTKVEFGVVLLENVAGFDHSTNPAAYADFSRRLFDLWGVGREGVNDGVLLVLFRGGRRVEVVTGAAVKGVLPDTWLGNMQRSVMVPHFKAGDYGAGVERGVKAICEKLAGINDPLDVQQAYLAASDRGYEPRLRKGGAS